MRDSGEFDLLIIEDDELAATNYKFQLSKKKTFPRFKFTICYDLNSGLKKLKSNQFDAVLLDLNLPDSDQEETILSIKEISKLAPLLVATSRDDESLAIKALNYGAQDYVRKNIFDLSSLPQNIVYAKERFTLRKELKRQQDAYQELLQNMLPIEVVNELKNTGTVKTRQYDLASVMFTDFVGFTESATKVSENELVEQLDFYFASFDEIIGKYNIEKIKTIGDSYMCASGIHDNMDTHAVRMILAAMEIRDMVVSRKEELNDNPLAWNIRIGINSGPVIAGAVGKMKFAYDIWGDAVNVASRLESCAKMDGIQISEECYQLIKDYFICTPHESFVRDLGWMQTYYVQSIRPQFSIDGNGTTPIVSWLSSLIDTMICTW